MKQIETNQNETKQFEMKQNKSKRNETKRNKTNRNETKQTKIKLNKWKNAVFFSSMQLACSASNLSQSVVFCSSVVSLILPFSH